MNDMESISQQAEAPPMRRGQKWRKLMHDFLWAFQGRDRRLPLVIITAIDGCGCEDGSSSATVQNASPQPD
jgi:hypothetical protein